MPDFSVSPTVPVPVCSSGVSAGHYELLGQAARRQREVDERLLLDADA